MNDNQEAAPDFLNQTAQTLVAIGLFMKHVDEHAAKAYLGAAVFACQRDGEMGDEIPQLVYQKVFPGEDLPTVVSGDIMETILMRKRQG